MYTVFLYHVSALEMCIHTVYYTHTYLRTYIHMHVYMLTYAQAGKRRWSNLEAVRIPLQARECYRCSKGGYAMYVCMHVCIYTCMYVRMHVCINLCAEVLKINIHDCLYLRM